MISRAKATATKVFSNSHIRTIFILGTLMIAALAGGAPSDVGGHH